MNSLRIALAGPTEGRESGENVHGLGVLPRGEVEFRFGVWDTVLVALHVTPSVLGRTRLGKVK